MKVTAIVLSAGKGTRVGGDIPKQYIEVAGRPVLAYCLDSFEKSAVDDVVIVTSAGNETYVREQIVDRFGLKKVSAVIAGGSERYFSVLNGLRYIGADTCSGAAAEVRTDMAADTTGNIENAGCMQTGNAKCDYVLIHDGARPYITANGVNKMIDAVMQYGAAVAAQPAKDTIKITDEQGFVTATTDRKLTWQVQTPQSFAFDRILQAYEKIVGSLQQSNSKTAITDDAMVYESTFAGSRVKLVDLKEENSKITTAEDLEYMRWKFEK